MTILVANGLIRFRIALVALADDGTELEVPDANVLRDGSLAERSTIEILTSFTQAWIQNIA